MITGEIDPGPWYQGDQLGNEVQWFEQDMGSAGATSLSYNDAPHFYRMRIPVGQASLTSTLTPLLDNEIEGPENMVLTLQSTENYNAGPDTVAEVTISDDVVVVNLTLEDGDAAEAGQQTGAFTVTRSASGNHAQHLDVIIALEGSAELNVDYSATSLSYNDAPNFYQMRILVGQASLTSTLTPIFDELIEGNETAVFTLESTNQYEKGNSVEATINITDFVERIFNDGFEDL